MLESGDVGASRLTQQIALPRMARFSSLSATIMCSFPDDELGLLCVNACLLVIQDSVLRSAKTILNCRPFHHLPVQPSRAGATCEVHP